MSTALDASDPASLAAEYLSLMETVAVLEGQAKLVKDNLVGMLPYTEGFKQVCGPAEVLWAKGRCSDKVDTKVLRRELVLAGVDLVVLEAAFVKATTSSVGQPTMRISKREDGQ